MTFKLLTAIGMVLITVSCNKNTISGDNNDDSAYLAYQSQSLQSSIIFKLGDSSYTLKNGAYYNYAENTELSIREYKIIYQSKLGDISFTLDIAATVAATPVVDFE